MVTCWEAVEPCGHRAQVAEAGFLEVGSYRMALLPLLDGNLYTPDMMDYTSTMVDCINLFFLKFLLSDILS